MITEDQVKEAAVKAGFPDKCREAFEIGLIQNLKTLNESLETSSTGIIRWLASGMYNAVMLESSQQLIFDAMRKFVTELFQDDELRATALKAVDRIKEILDIAEHH